MDWSAHRSKAGHPIHMHGRRNLGVSQRHEFERLGTYTLGVHKADNHAWMASCTSNQTKITMEAHQPILLDPQWSQNLK